MNLSVLLGLPDQIHQKKPAKRARHLREQLREQLQSAATMGWPGPGETLGLVHVEHQGPRWEAAHVAQADQASIEQVLRELGLVDAQTRYQLSSTSRPGWRVSVLLEPRRPTPGWWDD